MKMKRLLWGFMMVAALALLAGCGGGGGTSLMIDGVRATQDLIDAATGARDTAQNELKTANEDVTRLTGELETANDMIETLNLQIAEAPTQQMIDDLTTMRDNYKKQAEDLQDKLDTANGRITQLETDLKTANEELTKLKQDASDALAAAAKADRIAREKALRAAMGADNAARGINRVGTTTSRLPAADSGVAWSGDDSLTAATQFGVKRDTNGAITIDVNGTSENDAYTGGSVSAGSGDWTGATLTKTRTNKTEDTLVIYTDIEAPTDQRFTGVAGTGAKYSSGELSDLFSSTNRGLFYKTAMADEFPSRPNITKSYGDRSGNPLSFRGSISGVEGVFSCSGTCALGTNAAGELESTDNTSSGTWSFQADQPNTAMVKKPDAAYSWFGWWLKKPKDNTEAHTVQVFAGNSDQANNGNGVVAATALAGSATYTGKAVGKYITKSFSAGTQTDANVGHFTATASLTARFDDTETTTLVDDDAGTISGSISGFVLNDNDTTTASSWQVTLEKAGLNGTAASFNGYTEVNFGSGFTKNAAAGTPPNPLGAGSGSWTGAFYDATSATAQPEASKRYPNTVVGTFDAATENASVVGSFGAKR